MSPRIMMGLIFVLVGILLLISGYLIRVRKQLSLIAGYDPDQVKDKDGLSVWLGTGLLILGAIDGLFGLLTVFVVDGGPTALIIVLAITFLIIPIIMLGMRKYFK